MPIKQPCQKAGGATGLPEESTSPAELLGKAPTKIARALVYFRHFGDLNRFEAANKVGDTCLNSTIPALERYGLTFERQPEKVPNRWGAPCDVTRYSLPESQHQRARTVLALLNKPAKGRKEVAA
ncbi:hypothetical protein [Azotobacter armeniacus]